MTDETTDKAATDETDEDDDGFIVSIEEIIEDAVEKVKQPFEWLIGRRGN